MSQPSIMFVAREMKQTLLRKFSEVFLDSPFMISLSYYRVQYCPPNPFQTAFDISCKMDYDISRASSTNTKYFLNEGQIVLNLTELTFFNILSLPYFKTQLTMLNKSSIYWIIEKTKKLILKTLLLWSRPCLFSVQKFV